MSESTKGPWTCHSGMVWTDGPNIYPRGNETGIPIAKMDRTPGNGTLPEERDANARLIAAAPELLRALCDLLLVIRADTLVPESVSYMVEARAVIAKATGETQ